MSKPMAVPVIAQLKVGRLSVGAAWMRAWGRASVMAALMTLGLVLVAEGAPGDLDPTFGVGGRVTTDFGGFQQVAGALILQPDGKLVTAGDACLEDGCDFALARFLPDGGLDPTFGIGGRVTTDFEGGFDVAFALVLQPDGKLVAAGTSDNRFALARYLPDGRLDASFGVGGKVTTDFGGGDDEAFALVLQPDGRLVAAGISDFNGPADFALARYLPDGHLDASFGVGGTVTTDFEGGWDIAFALVLQPDGKLVATGFSQPSGLIVDFALARYLPDGHLDASFGVGGRVTTDFEGFFDGAHALVLQPDG